MEIKVCVGSSCHMKGSYQVINAFKDCIKNQGLEDKVQLKASFCMGHCLSGIAVEVDGSFVENVGFVNAQEIFMSQILPMVE